MRGSAKLNTLVEHDQDVLERDWSDRLHDIENIPLQGSGKLYSHKNKTFF